MNLFIEPDSRIARMQGRDFESLPSQTNALPDLYLSLTCLLLDITSAVGVIKMGNIAHRAEIGPTPPSLPHVTTLPTPTSLRGSLPERSVQTTTLVPMELAHNYKLWLIRSRVPRPPLMRLP